MKNKEIIAFSIADKNNLDYFKALKNSWEKFHPDIELRLIGEEEIKQFNDPMFFYRATPAVALRLFQEGFKAVVKIDADSIVTGDLSHTWEGDNFHAGVVQNSNPKEAQRVPVGVWDIPPMTYVNAGYVVMKDQFFVEHWWRLCASYHFNSYQYREQDLLNIMIFYGNYTIKFLDSDNEGNRWHGLASKGYWQNIKLKKDDLILPKNDTWPQSEDKKICIIHFAGGNVPNKMNIRLYFKPKVVKRLDYLISDDKEKKA